MAILVQKRRATQLQPNPGKNRVISEIFAALAIARRSGLGDMDTVIGDVIAPQVVDLPVKPGLPGQGHQVKIGFRYLFAIHICELTLYPGIVIREVPPDTTYKPRIVQNIAITGCRIASLVFYLGAVQVACLHVQGVVFAVPLRFCTNYIVLGKILTGRSIFTAEGLAVHAEHAEGMARRVPI